MHHLIPVGWQFVAQRFGSLRAAKAAIEGDDASWRSSREEGKQLTRTGYLVTTGRLPAGAFNVGSC
jgi:hypothetical protein